MVPEYIVSNIIFFVFIICIVLKIYSKVSAGKCVSPVCLVGKTALITGGNQGIGYETALGLASRGCRVIIADKVNGEESVKQIINHTNNPNVSYKFLDLASLKSVRTFVEDFYKSEDQLHILINCAGIACTEDGLTEDNINLGMQINHFGPFLLTYLLIDILKKSAPSRIIFVSSSLASFHILNETTLLKPVNSWWITRTYCNSKLCNIITADGFAKRLKGTGVTSNSLHPGLVSTTIFQTIKKQRIVEYIFFNWFLNPLFSKTRKQGAQIPLHLAISNQLKDVTGTYFIDCQPSKKPTIAYNEEFCQNIWQMSEQIVNIQANEKQRANFKC